MIIVNTLIAGYILSAVISAVVSSFVSAYVWISATRKRKAYQREIARASRSHLNVMYPWGESDDKLKQAIVEAFATMSPEQLRDVVEMLATYAEQSPAARKPFSEH